jgi:chromosome segregation ATPase
LIKSLIHQFQYVDARGKEMALTIEQLSDLVESLQTKVATLETTIKQYRQDISGLEQQLSESIKTDKLVVTGEAEISGRNILADRERLAEIEVSLQKHDKSIADHGNLLITHDTKLGEQHDDFDKRLTIHGTAIEGHEGRLTEAQGYIGAHEKRLNEHDGFVGAHEKRLNEHDGFIAAHALSLNRHDGTLTTHQGRLDALWNGTDDLVVQGNLFVRGNISYAGDISDSSPPFPSFPRR